MNKTCAVCFYLLLTVIGLFGLYLGIAGAFVSPQGVFGVLEPSGIPLLLPLAIGILFGLGGFLMFVRTLQTSSRLDKVVSAASSHKQITLDDISRYSGVKLPQVRPLVYRAIAEGRLQGTVNENTFVRSEKPVGEKVTVEREVMVTRKPPASCYKCGASINPKEVEWVGPDQVRCPHCGSTMDVRIERV